MSWAVSFGCRKWVWSRVGATVSVPQCYVLILATDR